VLSDALAGRTDPALIVVTASCGAIGVAGLLIDAQLPTSPWLAYGLIATEFLAAVTFPGPVFKVIIVLALGVAKGGETATICSTPSSIECCDGYACKNRDAQGFGTCQPG
jgi:hypothetical protein